MAGEQRLFVAAELPARVRALLASAAPGAPWRPVGADDLHVTLAFLGSRPAAHAQRVANVLDGAWGPPVAAALGETVLLPPRRPRVCAVRVVSPGLDAVQARVAGALLAAGLFEPEPRPFLGHVTVARGRGRMHRVRVTAAAEFEIAALALLESGHGGPPRPPGEPRYSAIFRTTLRA